MQISLGVLKMWGVKRSGLGFLGHPVEYSVSSAEFRRNHLTHCGLQQALAYHRHLHCFKLSYRDTFTSNYKKSRPLSIIFGTNNRHFDLILVTCKKLSYSTGTAPATRDVTWNLVMCCTTVREIAFEKVCHRWM